MATVFTHALVGSALAPLAPAGVSRSRLAFALAAVAVLPDLDALSFGLGIPYEHPLGHRGFSHSLLFAAILAAMVARFAFKSVAPWSRPWWSLFSVLFVATASHGILDSLTDGGLGVGFLIPFSSERFFAPVRPLPVSPIGIDGSVLAILPVEVLYIWLPLLGLWECLVFRASPAGTARPRVMSPSMTWSDSVLGVSRSPSMKSKSCCDARREIQLVPAGAGAQRRSASGTPRGTRQDRSGPAIRVRAVLQHLCATTDRACRPRE